jgi:hypothetical protein
MLNRFSTLTPAVLRRSEFVAEGDRWGDLWPRSSRMAGALGTRTASTGGPLGSPLPAASHGL